MLMQRFTILKFFYSKKVNFFVSVITSALTLYFRKPNRKTIQLHNKKQVIWNRKRFKKFHGIFEINEKSENKNMQYCMWANISWIFPFNYFSFCLSFESVQTVKSSTAFTIEWRFPTVRFKGKTPAV